MEGKRIKQYEKYDKTIISLDSTLNGLLFHQESQHNMR